MAPLSEISINQEPGEIRQVIPRRSKCGDGLARLSDQLARRVPAPLWFYARGVGLFAALPVLARLLAEGFAGSLNVQ